MPYYSNGSSRAASTNANGENENPQTDAESDGDNSAERNDSSSGNPEDLQAGCALTDWLTVCREKCQVERLRWFLRDADLFCKRQFGENVMATDCETAALEEFLFSNADNLKTAELINTLWPRITDQVRSRFMKLLATRIEENIKESTEKIPSELADDTVTSHDHGIRALGSSLAITLNSWSEYDTEKAVSAIDSRTGIWMQNLKAGPDEWILGISSPMGKSEMKEGNGDKSRRERLENRLRDNELFQKLQPKGLDDWWPHCEYVNSKYRNWSKLIPTLHEECRSGGGEVTDYFVDKMTELALTAIPIINEIEGSEEE